MELIECDVDSLPGKDFESPIHISALLFAIFCKLLFCFSYTKHRILMGPLELCAMLNALLRCLGLASPCEDSTTLEHRYGPVTNPPSDQESPFGRAFRYFGCSNLSKI